MLASWKNKFIFLYFSIFIVLVACIAKGQTKQTYKLLIEKANKEITAKSYAHAKKTLSEIDSNAFKPNQLEKGFYYQQLARLAYYDTYEDSKAVDYYYKAIKIYEINKSNDDIGIAYSNLVGVLTDLKRYKEAELAINKSLPFVKNNKIKYGNAYLNYSRLKLDVGDYKNAAIYNLQALKLFEQSGDQARIAAGNFQMGITMETSNQFEKAIAYYQKSLSIRKTLKDSLGMSNVYNNLGIVYKEEKKYDLAILNYKAAEDIGFRMGRPVMRINPLVNLAVIYTDLKNNEAAIRTYEEALEIAKKHKRTSSVKTIESNLAYIYLNANDYDKALPLAQKTYDYGKTNGTLEEKIAFSNNLGEILDGLNRSKEAFPYMQSALLMKDSLNNKQSNDAIAEMLTRFETQKKEQRIALLAKENTLQKLNIENQALILKQRSLEIDNRDFSLNLKNKEIESQNLKTSEQAQQIQLLAKEKAIKDLELKQKNIYLLVFIAILLVSGILGFQYYKKRKLAEINRMQEEKLRISRELHDNIGAQLSFINGSIQSLAAMDSKNQQLQQTQQITQNTIKELRSTVWLINQQSFGLEEFVVKLREYLKPYYGGTPTISIINKSDKDYNLEAAVATNLFRIIQELVNNAIKHSEATTLAVDFIASQNTLEASIKDNGKGYDLRASSAGYGLKNIQARTKAIKGSCRVETRIGQGTQVYLVVPI